MLYRSKVRLLRDPRGTEAVRRVRDFAHRRFGLGPEIGNYHRLPEYIRSLAPGRSFVDVGCMWGVNGEYAFLAEEAGATEVKGIDVFGPTPEFEAERAARGSRVEFVLGDATDPATIEQVGPTDVVFCAGVLYHHPSPFDLVLALRLMCRETLLLRSFTIPEMPGTRNMAVYWPHLPASERRMWQMPGLDCQMAISGPFDAADGYGNWFWGLTPSCVSGLLETAGFEVTYRAWEPFAHTFICRAVRAPLDHPLPSPEAARRLAEAISAAGVARPH